MQIQVFPSEQLGSGKEVNEMIRQGANVMNITDPGYLSDFVPDIGVLNGPYLIKDPKDYDKLLASDWYKGVEKKLEQAGFKLIMANGFFGQRHLIADKPVRTPADMAGMTVRVPPNTMWIETFKAMGARPTTVQWSEVYNALQQNVVAAAEAPLGLALGLEAARDAQGHLDDRPFHRVRHVADQRRATSTSCRADVQKVLLEEGKKAGDEMTRLTLELQKDYVAKFKAAGVTFVDDVDLAAFQKATAPRLQRVPEVDAGPARHRDERPAQVDRQVGGRRIARPAARGMPTSRPWPHWRVADQFEEIVACVALVVVVLAVSWGVLTRYITAQPAAWAERGRDPRPSPGSCSSAPRPASSTSCIPRSTCWWRRLPRAAAAGRALAQPCAGARLLRLHGLVRHALRDRRLGQPEPGAAAAADLAVRAGRRSASP